MEKQFEFIERMVLKALNYCLYGIVILYFTVWAWKPSTKVCIYEESPIEQETQEDDSEVTQKNWDRNVHVTVYNPVEAQCDSDPLITADNSKIDLQKLKRQRIRWAAVSRDLLAEVKFGDKIRITGCKEKELNGIWEVHDVMNSRFKKRVDLLYHQDIRSTGSGKANLEFLRD